MIFYIGLLSIVFAVSIDGFGVGVTYGIRKISISFSALFIIMLCSGMIVVTSMVIGHFIRIFIPPNITNIFGSIILITLGVFVLFSIIHSTFFNHHKNPTIIKTNLTNKSYHRGQKLKHLKSVMNDPKTADKDMSGTISSGEALVLGIALALDAFGAGLGAAMLGYSAILTAILIASMSGIFVYVGIEVGLLLSKNKQIEKLTFLPPILLITIGIINLL